MCCQRSDGNNTAIVCQMWCNSTANEKCTISIDRHDLAPKVITGILHHRIRINTCTMNDVMDRRPTFCDLIYRSANIVVIGNITRINTDSSAWSFCQGFLQDVESNYILIHEKEMGVERSHFLSNALSNTVCSSSYEYILVIKRDHKFSNAAYRERNSSEFIDRKSVV